MSRQLPFAPTVTVTLPLQVLGVQGSVVFTEGSCGPATAFAPLMTEYSQTAMLEGGFKRK